MLLESGISQSILGRASLSPSRSAVRWLSVTHGSGAFGACKRLKPPRQFTTIQGDRAALAAFAHEFGYAAMRLHEQGKASLLLLLVRIVREHGEKPRLSLSD